MVKNSRFEAGQYGKSIVFTLPVPAPHFLFSDYLLRLLGFDYRVRQHVEIPRLFSKEGYTELCLCVLSAVREHQRVFPARKVPHRSVFVNIYSG